MLNTKRLIIYFGKMHNNRVFRYKSLKKIHNYEENFDIKQRENLKRLLIAGEVRDLSIEGFNIASTSLFMTIADCFNWLTSIHLDDVGIDDEFLNALPVAATKSCLQELSLKNNKFSDLSLEHFARDFKKNIALRNLNLSGNNIGDLGLSFLFDAIGTESMLQELYINDVGATHKIICKLKKSLETTGVTKISVLGICWDRVNNEKVDALRLWFEENQDKIIINKPAVKEQGLASL